VSDPTDIKALDEYLKKGSEVSQRYRELGSDDVSPELDRRVLEAARAAVANESPSRSRSWLRWSAPLAVAASVVLVVTVVLEGGLQDKKTVALQQAPAEVRQEPRVEAAAVTIDDKAYADNERKLADELRKQQDAVSGYDVSAQNALQPARELAPPAAPVVAPAPAAASVPKAEAERSKSAAPLQELVVQGARRDESQMATSPVTVVTQEDVAAAAQPAEADSSADVQEVQVAGTRNRHAIGRTAGARGTVSTDSMRRETRPASDEPANRSDPQAWLEEIRELRREHKTQDADREWLRFREAFPDFPVADDDIARKKP
jgi:hypothetical protein